LVRPGWLLDFLGAAVTDRDGVFVGRITQVFVDDVTGQPEWIRVHLETTGRQELPGPLTTTADLAARPAAAAQDAVVPAEASDFSADGVSVPFTRRLIDTCPAIVDGPEQLSRRSESALYRHYDLG
jgi:hypothetical protein